MSRIRAPTIWAVVWMRSAAGWGLWMAAFGLILVFLEGENEPAAFLITMAFIGAGLGVFFQHQDRLDTSEDDALDELVESPGLNAQAGEWVGLLRNGQRVRSHFNPATLTPQGVEWSGRRKYSLRWQDVQSVAPRTMSHQGIRSVHWVYLWTDAQAYVIQCSKRSFAAVLATCAEMVANPPSTEDGAAT